MADTDRLAEIKERLQFTNGYSYAQLRRDAEWMAAKLDQAGVRRAQEGREAE